MCNLYSITRTQEAMRRLFRVQRDLLGNFPGLPAIFPDTMAPVVRTARGERSDQAPALALFPLAAFLQRLAAGKPRIKIAFEACSRPGALNHDQIIVLTLEARRGKVRGTGAQNTAVNLLAFQVHRCFVALGPDLDARGCG
jgi:hypothetical protein